MTRLVSRLAATAIAAVLLAGPALAQQSSANLPSASHLAAAREVVLASGVTRSFDAVAPQFYDQLRQASVSRPELQKDLEEVLKGLDSEMDLQTRQMVARAAAAYAAQLSEAELKEVATFFKSPVGVKYVNTQPQVLDALVREMQTWTQELSEYVMVRVRAEMAKRGHQMQ